MPFTSGTTLQDLTEAALEEIERQEAAMEGLESAEGVDEEPVVHEISSGEIFNYCPKKLMEFMVCLCCCFLAHLSTKCF